jgi:dUTP diphosphatase
MDVQLKIVDSRLLNWGFPRYGSDLAAGMDLYACIDEPICLGSTDPPKLISAGFSMKIEDPNWFAMVAPRSGWGHDKGLILGNTIGVIDADYHGVCLISAWNRNGSGGNDIIINPGDRIAQLLFVGVTRPSFSLVDELPKSETRGASGFGSTGL